VDCNKPFEDYPRAVYGWKRVFDGEGEDREEISESYWRAVAATPSSQATGKPVP
jgi:hypothetical protein